jgi:hypothetical protein
MKGFEFGALVTVKAIARRVIRNDQDFVAEHPASSLPVQYHERGVEVAPELAETVFWPERDGRPYARVVRDVLETPSGGIVVGHTNRQEGYRDPGGMTGGGGYQEPDYDPPSFIPTRIVSLLEVALPVGLRQKARIVLACPEDLETLSEGAYKRQGAESAYAIPGTFTVSAS